MTKSEELRVILDYVHGLRRDEAHVVHTPPESTIGGFSCVLLELGPDEGQAMVMIANGDIKTVPIEELSYRRP